MAFIHTDYSNIKENDYSPVPEGTYEVNIEDVAQDATKGGTEFIELKLRVRKDLDKAMPDTNGKYHNRMLFQNEWKRKKTGAYDQENLMRYLKAAKVPDNVTLDSFDDFADALRGKNVRVYVKVEDNTYKGKTETRNTMAAWNFEQTKYPTDTQQSSEDPFEATDNTITDEDIPF
ncbi:DUF669 domain-containing protein [Lactobacillus sp. PSON]|uniref:DUF669 domain-containing protein n=1 Tax=Lactobacillus sp. PSON TaxID=3455454 RepID=UPI0040411D1D